MYKPDIEQYQSTYPTAGIAIGLLQTVILLVFTRLWVVTYLGRKIHAAKISNPYDIAVFYIAILSSLTTQTPINTGKNSEKKH